MPRPYLTDSGFICQRKDDLYQLITKYENHTKAIQNRRKYANYSNYHGTNSDVLVGIKLAYIWNHPGNSYQL